MCDVDGCFVVCVSALYCKQQVSADSKNWRIVQKVANKLSHAVFSMPYLLRGFTQIDEDYLARKRGRFLLQCATQGMPESEAWAALLQLLDQLEDFAQHLIKARPVYLVLTKCCYRCCSCQGLPDQLQTDA